MTRNKLFYSIQCATLLGAVTVQAASAQETEEALEVEEVTVMGSRIKRSSEGMPGGAPITTIDKIDMEASGSMILSDVLRTSPLNSLGSFSERSGSSAQSNATVNLRGLGADRTLVMLNGRRLAGSPNLGANQINLNMLPMAVVESSNILADGGSAVYGSDAVAGVVDLVTYSDYEGSEFSVRYGDRQEDDGAEKAFSFVTGSEGEKSSSVFAIEYNRRDPIYDRDRPYTASSLEDKNGDGRITLGEETVGVSIFSRNVYINDPSTGYEYFGQLNNCEGEGFTANIDDEGDTVCGYSYADISANKAGLERLNTFYTTTYDVSDSVEFFFDGLFSRVESFGRYAPPAAVWRNMPADHPALPADANIDGDDATITGYFRWDNIGPRDNTVTDIQYDLAAGFRGDITENLSFNTYLQHDRYESKEFGTYYLSIPGREYLLDQGKDLFEQDENGEYVNAAALRATTSQNNYTELEKVYFDLQYNFGDLLGTGEIIALAGSEYYEQNYVNQYDSQSEAGLVGGSAGNSSSGDRSVLAAFTEVIVPVFDGAELNLAARYDDYSDFGTNVSPSAAFTWLVGDDVTVRARYSQGFRAPALSELYGPETFSARSARDWVSCRETGNESCAPRQYNSYESSNPDLKAETSTSFSTGFNWAFLDSWGAFEDWSVDVNYYKIDIDDVIGRPSVQGLIYAELAGSEAVSSSATRPYVDRSGPRPEFYSESTNVGTESLQGLDVKLAGNLQTSFGRFGLNTLVTRQLSYESNIFFEGPSQDLVGFSGRPKMRGQVAFDWSLGAHRVDLVYNYIGSHPIASDVNVDVNTSSVSLVPVEDRYRSNETINLSYGFDAGSLGKIKAGVNNLLNEEPSLSPTNNYSADLYDNTGRVLFVEYKLKI